MESRLIVVDENIPFAREAFGELGRVEPMPGRAIRREHLLEASALIVRSITRVDAALLEGTPVRFVGTCTIGTDHLDKAWLDSTGVAWSSAPGCNARSVAEYLGAAWLALHAERRIDLSASPVVGIVGCGNVGRQVEAVAGALGLPVLRNDPPRAIAEGSTGFCDLGRIAAEGGIATFHVPLVRDGDHPTAGLASEAFLHALRPGAVLCNTARGGVAATSDLRSATSARPDLVRILDVFDPEPSIPVDVARGAFVATPHIAGYSFEGKVEGTRRIRNTLGALFGAADWSPPASDPQSLDAAHLEVEDRPVAPSTPPFDALAAVVLATYDPRRDSRALAAILDDPDGGKRGAGFDHLRKTYPVRREWAAWTIRSSALLPPATRAIAARLGFSLG